MPFQEIPHGADWCLRVWAEDLNQLFIDSAKGMNNLAGIKLSSTPGVRRKISIASSDAESLLVAFLSELVFLGEHNHLGFVAMNYPLNQTPVTKCTCLAA